MRARILLLPLLAIFLCSVVCSAESFLQAGIAPDFGGIIDGKFFRLYKHRDKVVFVDFFSILGTDIADLYEREYLPCQTCIEHLRILEQLYEELKGSVLIVAVSVDFKREWVERVVRENRLSFPIIYDPGRRIMEHYEVKAMPTSFLIKGLYIKGIAKGARSRECYLQGIFGVLEEGNVKYGLGH